MHSRNVFLLCSVDPRAYLDVELHAEPCLRFLTEYFGAPNPWPAAGVCVTVFMRFDSDHRPPLTLRMFRDAGRASVGAPLELYMYNSSGRGMYGFHYDPLWLAPPGSIAVEEASGSGVAAAPPLAQLAGGAAHSGRGCGGPLLKRRKKT